MEIKVRTKEQQAIDNLKAIVNSKDKIIEIEPPIEDTAQILLDIISNLEEELEDLREDNYAYHQLMKMQNKREFRSKFLKEFQEEFGTNTFPDYDEIYKRYDKLKKENERLKLNQTKKVFDTIAGLIKNGETCSYRYLIYDLLGFQEKDYADLMGGLAITNMLVDYEEYKSRNEEAYNYLDKFIPNEYGILLTERQWEYVKKILGGDKDEL